MTDVTRLGRGPVEHLLLASRPRELVLWRSLCGRWQFGFEIACERVEANSEIVENDYGGTTALPQHGEQHVKRRHFRATVAIGKIVCDREDMVRPHRDGRSVRHSGRHELRQRAGSTTHCGGATSIEYFRDESGLATGMGSLVESRRSTGMGQCGSAITLADGRDDDTPSPRCSAVKGSKRSCV